MCGTEVEAFWEVAWDSRIEALIGAKISQPASQSLWELMAMFLALEVFASECLDRGMLLCGDNLAALEAAANLRGRGPAAAITREVAWRRAARRWRYAVAHVPTEANDIADSLSRLHAPEPAAFPAVCRGARQVPLPAWEELFLTL